MSLTEKISQIIINAESAKSHIENLEKGKKASASKGRAELLKIKNIAHQLRKECMTKVKSIPVKPRATKPPPVVAKESAVESAPKTK